MLFELLPIFPTALPDDELGLLRVTNAELIADANRRIAACTDREFWITAVLYLGIKPNEAREIRRRARAAAIPSPRARLGGWAIARTFRPFLWPDG